MTFDPVKIFFFLIPTLAIGLYGSDLKSRHLIQRENFVVFPKKNITRTLNPPPPLIKSSSNNFTLRENKGVQPSLLIENSMTLDEYVTRVIENGMISVGGDIEAKLEVIRTKILQNRYDFVVNYQAYLSASQLPTATEGMGTTLNGRMGVQANKILYDGNRKFFKEDTVLLSERFEKYKKLSLKEQSALMGADLYLRLLETRSRLEFIQKYRQLDHTVYATVMQKYDKGVSDNAYNHINAKMDRVALEKVFVSLQYDLHNATIVFKQSAALNDNEEVTLRWPTIETVDEHVEVLTKKAIERNFQIAYAETLFRLKKGEIAGEIGRNDWTVDLSTFAGVGYSNTKTSVTDSTSSGLNWMVALQANYPLTQSSIDLETERKMVEALKEKNNLSLTRQNMIQRINRLYTEMLRETEMLGMIQTQKELAERHLKITRYRLEAGLEPYSTYAASMKKLIEIEEDMLMSKIRLLRNRYELRLLVGDANP